MALDQATLQQVATLARLQLDAQQSAQLEDRLNDILVLVDALQKADVSDLAPLSHPLEITQPLRADKVASSDWREAVMAQAPATEDNYFLVPQVIE